MTSPPPPPTVRPVLAVMSDLLFRSKIDDAATRAGMALRVAKSLDQLERHLATSAPALAIVDLECDALDTGAAIRRLRALPEGAQLPIIGYAGHTNTAAIAAGRAAGAGVVLARSAFTAQLLTIVERAAADERARGPAA